jgi:hypothetical protein
MDALLPLIGVVIGGVLGGGVTFLLERLANEGLCGRRLSSFGTR